MQQAQLGLVTVASVILS